MIRRLSRRLFQQHRPTADVVVSSALAPGYAYVRIAVWLVTITPRASIY